MIHQTASDGPTGLRSARRINRKVNALVFLSERVGPEVLPYLLQNPDLNLRVISESAKSQYQTYMDADISLDKVQWFENTPQDLYKNHWKMHGHQLARWADLLFIVTDASMTSLMIAGYTTDIGVEYGPVEAPFVEEAAVEVGTEMGLGPRATASPVGFCR